MSNWIITGNVFDNSFQILSSIGGEIIDLQCDPVSLRDLGLHTIKHMVMRSKCQSCAVLSMQLPKEVEADFLKILPGEYLVRMSINTLKHYCNIKLTLVDQEIVSC